MGGRKVRWTSAMDALLGTDTDKEVASKLNLPRQAVYTRRRLLGIAPAQWWSDELDRFGKTTDIALAKEFGVTRERIRQIREEYGIPKFKKVNPMWDRVRHQLGILDDAKIAEMLGVEAKQVSHYRRLHHIPMKTTPTERSLDERKDIPRNWRDFVGVESDRQLSLRWGIPLISVALLRKRLNRPPAYPKVPNKVNWKDPANLERLGVVPDSQLAEEWGVSQTAISFKRKKLKIPPAPRQKRKK